MFVVSSLEEEMSFLEEGGGGGAGESIIGGGRGGASHRTVEGDKKNDMGIYFGQAPRVLSGQVEANVPTSFDSSGQLVYTKQNLDILR